MDRFQEQIETFSGKPLGQRREWYSSTATLYDRVRPRYPAPLLERLTARTSLTAGTEILEVGCGPGTATTDLARLGCPITALEPNPDFCVLARENCSRFSNVTILNTTFEEWSPEGRTFDVVVSASAFHWIPAAIGYPKAASVLRPGGRLILLWNKELQPDFRIHQRLGKVYAQDTPSLHTFETFDQQVQVLNALSQGAVTSGLFTDLNADFERFAVTYAGVDYVDLLRTYSKFIQLEDDTRERLLTGILDFINLELDGRIELFGVAAAFSRMKDEG